MKKREPWDPEAIRKPGRNSGTMQGKGHRIITLHDPGARSSASGVVSWILQKNIEYTMVLDDENKKVYQLFPFNRGARSMGNHGVNGGWGNNKSGEINIQICIVTKGRNYGSENAALKLSDWGIKKILEIAEAWDIPLKVGNKKMNAGQFIGFSGITYHSRGPYEDHTDVGYIPEDFFIKKAKELGITEEPRTRKVTARRKNGKVQLIRVTKKGTFTFNKNRGRMSMTKAEARKAKAWAKKKNLTGVRNVGQKDFPFVKVAKGVKRPPESTMIKLNREGRNKGVYMWVKKNG